MDRINERLIFHINDKLVIDELASALQYMAQGASMISTMEKLLHAIVTVYVEYHEDNTSLYARSNSVLLLKEEILSDRANAIASQRGWIYEKDEVNINQFNQGKLD